MRRSPAHGKLHAAALAVVVFALGAATLRYSDGPPPAHTGGFGEPTCRACHFDAPLNDAGGRLTLEGLPKGYAPGQTYRLRITVAHPSLAAGGFQLSARFPDGAQAGAFDVDTTRIRTHRVDTSGVVYVSHAKAGMRPAAPDTARWSLRWRAPERPDSVRFHLAANAANGDDSEFGDFIFTHTAATAPKR